MGGETSLDGSLLFSAGQRDSVDRSKPLSGQVCPECQCDCGLSVELLRMGKKSEVWPGCWAARRQQEKKLDLSMSVLPSYHL